MHEQLDVVREDSDVLNLGVGVRTAVERGDTIAHTRAKDVHILCVPMVQ